MIGTRRGVVGSAGRDLHAKRVLSLTNATLGVIKTASLAVNTIGQGLALARGLVTKHAIKQVDRLLSNEGIDIDAALCRWIPYVVGSRTSINVAMDWTDFDADGQATIMLSLLTRHGRREPKAPSSAACEHSLMEWRTEGSHAASVAHGEHIHPQEPAERL
jgi:hypothetical protein